MSDSTQNTKPITFELDRYSLFAPVEGNKRATLQFGIRERYPRLTVFTQLEDDNNGKGFITAAFDIDHFLMFLNRLERIARSETVDVKEKISTKHWPRDSAGKITGDKEVTSEVWYGKNKDGVVWLSVTAPNRPKIVFEITVSDYHEFFNLKGERLSNSEASVLRTIVLIGVLRHHMTSQALSFRDISVPRTNTKPYSQRNKTVTPSAPVSTPAFDESSLDFDIPY